MFFTNSIHVPVYKKISIFKKFETEAKLAKFSNAGCITYGEISDSVKHNLDSLYYIVRYGKDLDLPYIALNFVINECTQCGNTDNLDEEIGTCPVCGATKEFINWLRRITGYLNGNYLRSFNLGKQCETQLREDHEVESELKNIKFKY